MDQPDSRRAPVLTVLMVIFGILLLLPGVCAIFFMVGMGGSGSDSAITLLWIICLLIAAGGVWLIVRAFR
jgi:lipopolysaccharide export LptBFGC system permease protein LptF